MKKTNLFLIAFWLIMPLFLSAQEADIVKKKNTGLYGTVEFSYLKTVSTVSDYVSYPAADWQLYGKSLRIGLGYFVNPHFSVGMGFGADRYESPGANTFPLYVDFRGYLKDEASSPYLFFDIGNSIKFSDAQQKGLLLDAGVGYKFFVGKSICLTGSLGYNYKHFSEWMSYTNETTNSTEWASLNRHSLTFKLGIFF